MAASAASPAHQGRLVLAAVLAGGLIVLGLVVARKYLNAKKKSSKSAEETVAKKEVKEILTKEETKKVESIKEESEPEGESEPEPISTTRPESPDTHSSTLKVELKADPDQFQKREISVSPARFLPSPTPESAPVEEVIENAAVKLTESAAPSSSASEPVSAVTELVSEEPEEESVKAEEETSSEPTEEPAEENEIVKEESAEDQCVKDTLVKPEESKLDPEAEPFMPRDSTLIQQFSPSDGSIVSEIVASGMGGESLAEPIEKEADMEALSDEEAIASSEVEKENLSAEMAELKEVPEAVASNVPEAVASNDVERENMSAELKEVPEAVASNDVERENVSAEMEDLKEIPEAVASNGVERENMSAEMEELKEVPEAIASNDLERENMSAEMEELKQVAEAVVSGPQSADYDFQKQALSLGTNYTVIDTDQANNNSLSPELSESDHHLSVGQYDDADENQKAADHDLNSDSPFDFFDLATSPNDFKPSFDFVDPNENLTVQRGSDEDIEVISDQKGQDENEYIPDMALEDMEGESPSDYSANDISSALDASNNNPNSIGTQQLEVLVSLILAKDYDIQQAAMAGVVKCAAFTDNQNSLRELGCHKKLAILLKSYVTSMKVGYNVSTTLISSVANAISNMSVNDKNQIVLQETVPLLVDLTVEGEMKESALLSTLRALTNLSTTERHHGQYTRMVQHLYNLMDAGSTPVKLQALKVLVNLSCSADMVQHLLAAKAPHSLLELLQQDAEEALVLRWTTLLANIVHTVRVNKMSQSSLPCPDKAASPETMYTAIYGVQSMGDLKNKIFLLSKHRNEDICYQAARVYSGLVR